jgi:hypothetical protein
LSQRLPDPARGERFYLECLQYAQRLWIGRKPAQAMLQLNKALSADLPEDAAVFEKHPAPYRPMAWLMAEAALGNAGFGGNPVRHFQHLATRMSGPRGEIRAWRAWFCFHLAERVLEGRGADRDGVQIAREGVWIPSAERALAALGRLGWAGEAEVARAALNGSWKD